MKYILIKGVYSTDYKMNHSTLLQESSDIIELDNLALYFQSYLKKDEYITIIDTANMCNVKIY